MEPKYIYSESTEQPSALEVGTKNVYLRKDIVSENRTDMDGNKMIFWTYQEAVMSVDEFNQYANTIAMKNAIDGIDNAENILTLLEKSNSDRRNQIILMQALADIYDLIDTTS